MKSPDQKRTVPVSRVTSSTIPKLPTLTNIREWYRVNVPEVGLVQDSMGGYHFASARGSGVRKADSATNNITKYNTRPNKIHKAEDIIFYRVKDFDLNEYSIPYKQLGTKKMNELKMKLENRSITKKEYNVYMWNKRFASKRDKGVKKFWKQEKTRLLNNETPTRNWTNEQTRDILNNNRPKFEGSTIQGHHSFSASKYPHLSDKGEVIYPVTHKEHLYGNYKKSLPGRPIIDITDF